MSKQKTKAYLIIQRTECQKIQNLQGSLEELEELLKEYDIKSHMVTSEYCANYGNVYFYNHYVLELRNQTQI